MCLPPAYFVPEVRMADNDYVRQRVDDQIQYFDTRAQDNQRAYRTLKSISIVCNVLTTLTIALAFTVPDAWRVALSIGALVLSTMVLATYQWEEFQNYGAKWEKFRLVAEQLKSEKHLFVAGAGRYSGTADADRKLFAETVEGITKGTDLSYFALLVDPGRRIEKRLQG